LKTDFFEQVYQVTRMIPKGRVTTYGIIADHLGSRQSSRMVGWALNHSHAKEEFVPAHRVVNRNGMLSGKHHFGGEKTMEQLLKSEGIEVIDDKILNFKALLWYPTENL